MAKKKISSKEQPHALQVKQKMQTETLADAIARTSLEPSVQAALTVMDYNKEFGELSINKLVDSLVKQSELANKGDLSRAEAILITQAHTLDAIFHKLARDATKAEYLNQFDMKLRLALKAQSQCRSTLETLAAIKNPPPVAFVRQANIAHGPQQVNNTAAVEGVPAEKSKIRPNKVLEHQHDKRLDLGTPGETSCVDSSLETLGAVHRSKNAHR